LLQGSKKRTLRIRKIDISRDLGMGLPEICLGHVVDAPTV